MADVLLRKYGAATTVDFELYETDGVDFKVDAVSATGDVTLNRDEAGAETLDDDQFTDRGSGYSLELSAAEMTAKRIIIYIADQGTKTWLDKCIIVETYGNASAQHPFDLGSSFTSLLQAATGFTEGGTWTLQKQLKVISAFMVGKKQLKSGETDVYEFLDPEDGSTSILEMTVSSSSPYFTFSVQI